MAVLGDLERKIFFVAQPWWVTFIKAHITELCDLLVYPAVTGGGRDIFISVDLKFCADRYTVFVILYLGGCSFEIFEKINIFSTHMRLYSPRF